MCVCMCVCARSCNYLNVFGVVSFKLIDAKNVHVKAQTIANVQTYVN